jgi:hypothetical protein
MECQSGTEVDTCVPGTPVVEGPVGDPTCTDGLDNDCDGQTDAPDPDCDPLPNCDNDGDGWCGSCIDPSCQPGDCNDNNPQIFPNAPTICDGFDNNCDNYKDFLTDEDKDNDGVPWCAGDCNDNDPNKFPGNQEGPLGDPTCSDGTDNDCDGMIDDLDTQCQNTCNDPDGDGYGCPGDPTCWASPLPDCDCGDPTINPGIIDDNCDGVDDNCNGTADEG